MRNRGQILPAWFTSIALTAIFALLLSSYGQLVAFQFRAQSAADAAAEAIAAQQSQTFNQMLVAIYASDVEEYRIRQLLESIRVAASQDGGCRIGGTCNDVWHRLIAAYRRSLARYGADAALLSRVTATMNFENAQRDASLLIDHFNGGCTDARQRRNGVDCGNADALMRYHLVAVRPRITFRTRNNYADTQSQNTTAADYNTPAITSVANPDFFAPIAAEVAVCADLPPLLPVWPFKSSKIVARAAATPAVRTDEIYDVGGAIDPLTGTPFQASQFYGDPSSDGADYYGIDFVGNSIDFRRYDDDYYLYMQSKRPGLQVQTGWWGGVPILPFTGPAGAADLNQRLGESC